MSENQPSMTETRACYCDLGAISSSAAHGAYEIDRAANDIVFDELSPVVEKGIIVRLRKVADKKCPTCFRQLRTEPSIADALACPQCGEIFSTRESEEPRWVISERGMATFVAKTLAHGWIHTCPSVFHLGELSGRDLFFAIDPTEEFFRTHGERVSLVAAGSMKNVPKGWDGRLALFHELFYLKSKGTVIGVAPNFKRNILPGGEGRRKYNAIRIIHERRDLWVQFLAWLFSRPYNPKEYYRGKLKLSTVRDWFVKNVPGAPDSTRTYRRDLKEFRHLCEKTKDKNVHDLREPQIIMLLKHANDATMPQERRSEIAKAIVEIALRLKTGRERNGGNPIEMPRCEWQYTGDKDGTRELVAVTEDTTDDIEL